MSYSPFQLALHHIEQNDRETLYHDRPFQEELLKLCFPKPDRSDYWQNSIIFLNIFWPKQPIAISAATALLERLLPKWTLATVGESAILFAPGTHISMRKVDFTHSVHHINLPISILCAILRVKSRTSYPGETKDVS